MVAVARNQLSLETGRQVGRNQARSENLAGARRTRDGKSRPIGDELLTTCFTPHPDTSQQLKMASQGPPSQVTLRKQQGEYSPHLISFS